MKNKLIALFIALIGLIFTSVQGTDALTLHGHAQINDAPAAHIVLPGHAEISSYLGVNTLSYGQNELRPPLSGRTYMFSTGYIVPASSPTDVLTVTPGSANLEILECWISMYADNGGGTTVNYAVYGIKRSTADSGGTSATVTGVSASSDDAAYGCTVRTYSANPSSLGTTVGQVAAWNGPVNYNACPATFTLYRAPLTGKPLTLKGGTTENFVINLGTITIYTTGKFQVNLILRERP